MATLPVSYCQKLWIWRDRCHRGRPQGSVGHPGRRARKPSQLAAPAAGPEGSRPERAPLPGRRRVRFLEGSGGGVAWGPAPSSVGCIRRPMSSTSCPSGCALMPRVCCTRCAWRPAREDALAAYDRFLGRYQDKYPKACECLRKDRDVMVAFYDFPAAHWVRLRTTNPIESTFATVRHRTRGYALFRGPVTPWTNNLHPQLLTITRLRRHEPVG